MDEKGSVLSQWRPCDCNESSGIGPFNLALNANVGIRMMVRLSSVVLSPLVRFAYCVQFPGDLARVYFVCDGVQHMFVQVRARGDE